MPIRQIILHIGRHKSGTSSLQHFMGTRRALLSRQGILFPRAGSANNIAHHTLALQCNPKQSDGAELESIRTAILAEIKPHHDRILLSSEAFQNINNLSRLSGMLASFGTPEILVVCYVREHLDYAISSFRQLVQNQARFVTFARHAEKLDRMGPFVKRWAALGALSLKWYNRADLKDGDVIADFCDQTGIDPGEIPDGDMNPSIGGNLLAYKLAASHLGLPGLSYKELRNLAVDHARFRASFHVSDEAAALLRANSAYNRSLIKRLGTVEMKSWARHAPLPETDTIEADLALILPEADTATRDRLAAAMAASAPWFDLTSGR